MCSVVSSSLRLRDLHETRRAPLSMGFPRQGTGVGCHFLLRGSTQSKEELSLESPVLTGTLFITSAPGGCCVLSRLSHAPFFAAPWTVSHQAPLSTAFSAEDARVGCHALLQGIFPTQESNAGLSHLLRWPGGLFSAGAACKPEITQFHMMSRNAWDPWESRLSSPKDWIQTCAVPLAGCTVCTSFSDPQFSHL